MANEIHNTLKNGQQPMKLERDSVERASRQLPKGPHEASDRPGQDDRITLTKTATELRDLSQRMVDEPFVGTQEVARIKQQLAEGTYEIDAAQIADRLLAHEQFLGGGKAR